MIPPGRRYTGGYLMRLRPAMAAAVWRAATLQPRSPALPAPETPTLTSPSGGSLPHGLRCPWTPARPSCCPVARLGEGWGQSLPVCLPREALLLLFTNQLRRRVSRAARTAILAFFLCIHLSIHAFYQRAYSSSLQIIFEFLGWIFRSQQNTYDTKYICICGDKAIFFF